jgi:hypothetical protein
VPGREEFDELLYSAAEEEAGDDFDYLAFRGIPVRGPRQLSR